MNDQIITVFVTTMLFLLMTVPFILIIHVTVGFKEFFEDWEAIFKRNPQEYLRKKHSKKNPEHP